MNAKSKVLGFPRFTANCVLNIPIIVCDVVRTIIAYACVDNFRNEYNSVCECVNYAYHDLWNTTKEVYECYMGKDVIEEVD